MPRKKSGKTLGRAASETCQPGPLTDNPFKRLRGYKIEEYQPVTEPEKTPEPVPEDDESLFNTAMADVEKIKWKYERVTAGSPKKEHDLQEYYSEDDGVLAHLSDLVAGRAQFDIVDTDEYLEGSIKGVHPMIVRKLRMGRFSVQAYLDLHGLTVREATEAVRDFIQESVGLGYRCVLLVHGRGLNSKDQIPVLKQKLNKILLTGPTKKHILAFTTARPVDGGAGASYVLLRAKKTRKKSPVKKARGYN